MFKSSMPRRKAIAPASRVCAQTLKRFPEPYRRHVALFARLSQRVGELSDTYPLLLFGLATSYGGLQERMALVAAVEAGMPLPQVAAQVGLPLFLRRLPPEACRAPLPCVGFSAELACQLANHLPDGEPDLTANWATGVFHAKAMAGDEFSLWISRQKHLHVGAPLDPALLRPLALYAWFTTHGPASPLGSLARTPWNPRMSLSSVIVETKYWLNRLKLLVAFGEREIPDTWVAPGPAGVFQVVALTNFALIMAERDAMRNCLDFYADKVNQQNARLFSIRHNGRRVATMEIGPHPLQPGKLHLVQLKGPENSEAPMEVWQAAWSWLSSRRFHTRSDQPVVSSEEMTRRLHRMLIPYARRNGRAELHGLTCKGLDESLALLARRIGVSGWPFSRLVP